MRISVLALLAVSCQLHDGPMDAQPAELDIPLDAMPPPFDGAPSDASIDASHCVVDRDHDGSCADLDCDDLNARRSPLMTEYCPDRLDNDCDEIIDYDDACDSINDDCQPVTVLLQDPELDTSYWAFDLPLGERYADDFTAGLSAGDGNCTGDTGRGGNDAVFELDATTDAAIDVTAAGSGNAEAVVIVRSVCEAGQESDLCDAEGDSDAHVQGALDAEDRAWLIVDDAATAPSGHVHVEIRISKRGI